MSDMMVLGELLEEHRKLKAAVDRFGAKLEAVYGFTNETNVVVKDILSGRQISEWIADLEASGTASNTYSDADRMNALINDADACKNNNITQLIFDWGVLNNKTGNYINTMLGMVAGVNWELTTTPAQVCENEKAFEAIANSERVFTTFINNATSRLSIFEKIETTRAIFESSVTASNVMKQNKTTVEFLSESCSWKYYDNVKIYAYRIYSNAICCMHENYDGETWVFDGDWNDDSPDIPYDHLYRPWVSWVDINDVVVRVGARNDSRGCSDKDPVKFECFNFEI